MVNMITIDGIKIVGRGVDNQTGFTPEWIAIGSGGESVATSGDTALSYEPAGARKLKSVESYDTKQVEFSTEFGLNNPDSQPVNIREIGVFTGSPTGSMYSREVFKEISKSDTEAMKVITCFRFDP